MGFFRGVPLQDGPHPSHPTHPAPPNPATSRSWGTRSSRSSWASKRSTRRRFGHGALGRPSVGLSVRETGGETKRFAPGGRFCGFLFSRFLPEQMEVSNFTSASHLHPTLRPPSLPLKPPTRKPSEAPRARLRLGRRCSVGFRSCGRSCRGSRAAAGAWRRGLGGRGEGGGGKGKGVGGRGRGWGRGKGG